LGLRTTGNAFLSGKSSNFAQALSGREATSENIGHIRVSEKNSGTPHKYHDSSRYFKKNSILVVAQRSALHPLGLHMENCSFPLCVPLQHCAYLCSTTDFFSFSTHPVIRCSQVVLSRSAYAPSPGTQSVPASILAPQFSGNLAVSLPAPSVCVRTSKARTQSANLEHELFFAASLRSFTRRPGLVGLGLYGGMQSCLYPCSNNLKTAEPASCSCPMATISLAFGQRARRVCCLRRV